MKDNSGRYRYGKLLLVCFCAFGIFFTCVQNVFGGIPVNVRAKHAMVVSGHQKASEAGIEILRRGGNAVDAAVTVGFALAVVFPEAGNIGGGGFALTRLKDGTSTFVDFREKAPERASRDMYLDSAGNVTDESVNGHLSVGVPGSVAGLIKLLELHGRLTLAEVLQPALDLAEGGFIVDNRFTRILQSYEEDLVKYPSTVVLLKKNNTWLAEGDTFVQPQLAATLKRIQHNGSDGFYKGETARLLIEEIERGGGIMTAKDLSEYRAVVRNPMQTSYRGYTILSASPPSSGGICLFQMLGMLEHFNFQPSDFHSSRTIHLMTEAMKRTYADRAEYMGDPDFTNIPIKELISKEYLHQRYNEIDSVQTTPSTAIRFGNPARREPEHTTHYSIIDEEGNVVSVTTTLNDLFGSKVVVSGAGFFLNDEMDDFSSKPGTPNIYGLIGSEANAIMPAKRPLSSMMPTIVVKEGQPLLALGARGGSRIITAVFQVIMNVLDFGMNIQDAVNAPRFHHQYLPDTLLYEQYCFPTDVVQNLNNKGHNLKQINASVGQIEAIFRDPKTGWIFSGADPREGGVAIGY